MSALYSTIEKRLSQKERNLTWLSKQVGYSRQGLKASLVNETIRLDTLEKIAGALNIPIIQLIYPNYQMEIAEAEAGGIISSLDSMEETNNLKEENSNLRKRIEELEEIRDLYRDKVEVYRLMPMITAGPLPKIVKKDPKSIDTKKSKIDKAHREFWEAAMVEMLRNLK